MASRYLNVQKKHPTICKYRIFDPVFYIKFNINHESSGSKGLGTEASTYAFLICIECFFSVLFREIIFSILNKFALLFAIKLVLVAYCACLLVLAGLSGKRVSPTRVPGVFDDRFRVLSWRKQWSDWCAWRKNFRRTWVV